MKIKEVILEAPTITIPPWTPSNPSLTGPTSSIAPRPRAQRQSGQRAAALTRKKNIRVLIDTLWGGGIPGKGGKNIVNPRMKAALDSKYWIFRNGARGVRFLQWLGFLEFAEAWWKDRAALVVMRDLPPDDPQYEEMHLTDEEFDMYTTRLAEEWLVKIVASSVMPGIIRGFVRMITFSRYFAALFPAIASGGVGTVASLSLLIASEYAMTQFQNWLNSQPGKMAVSKAVASLIDPTFHYFEDGIVAIWDRITALVTGEEKKKPDAKPTDKPAGKETPTTGTTSTDTGTTRTAGQGARPADSPVWAKDEI